MSYNSSYGLKVEYKGMDKINEVIKYLLENLQEYQEMIFTLDILDNRYINSKWYQYNHEMIKLSKIFPNYVFTLCVDGEISDNNQRNYYMNGKMDYNVGVLPTELRIEYEKLEKLENERSKKIKELEKIVEEKERVYKSEEEVFYSSFDITTGKIIYTKYERSEMKEHEREDKLMEIKKIRKKLKELYAGYDLYHDFYNNNYDKLIFRDFDESNLESLDFYFDEKDNEEDIKLSSMNQSNKINREIIHQAELVINKILNNEYDSLR